MPITIIYILCPKRAVRAMLYLVFLERREIPDSRPVTVRQQYAQSVSNLFFGAMWFAPR